MRRKSQQFCVQGRFDQMMVEPGFRGRPFTRLHLLCFGGLTRDEEQMLRRRVVVRQMAARFQSPAQFRIQALNRASETVDRGDAK
jgi:hypothetical protein